MEQQKCVCDCKSFSVFKISDKWIMLKCKKCKCERRITTPGIAVDEYFVDPYFIGCRGEDEELLS